MHSIQKIDNFEGHPAPLLRFRASLEGPCIGECFGNFVTTLDERKKWDAQIEQVKELYTFSDLETVNSAMGFGQFGHCSRLGVGYCQTKANVGISAREQLTLCGMQDFADGSCIIWATELPEWHNHLMPPTPRHGRSKSHIFATTLTPTSDSTFDVEYLLQLEVGGKIPTWMTTPVVTQTVKNLFSHAESFYTSQKVGGPLDDFLKQKALQDNASYLAGHQSLLMTP